MPLVAGLPGFDFVRKCPVEPFAGRRVLTGVFNPVLLNGPGDDGRIPPVVKGLLVFFNHLGR